MTASLTPSTPIDAYSPRGPRPKQVLNPRRIMLYAVLVVALLYYILPLWVMVMTSLKGMPESGWAISLPRLPRSPLSHG